MSDEKKVERPTASSESDQDEDELSEQIKTYEETFSPSFHKESQRSAEHNSEDNFTAGSCSEPELLPCSQSDDSSDHSDNSVPIESSQLHCSTCKRIKSQSSAVQDPETLQESLPDDQQRYTDGSHPLIRSETLQESLPGDQQRCTNGSDPFIRSETLQESLPDDGQQRSPNASRSFVLFPDEIRSTDTPIPYHLLSPERRALLEQQRYEQFFERCISLLQPETVQESLSDAHQTFTDASGPFIQPETLRESHSGAYQTSTDASGPFVQLETLRESHSGAHQASTGAFGPFGRPETFQESSPQSQPRHQPEAEEFPLYYIFLRIWRYMTSVANLEFLAN